MSYLEDNLNSFLINSKCEEIQEFVENNLNHPLVFHCCKDLGISHDQLKLKHQHDFQESVSNPTAAVRYQHYEARRKACIQIISSFIQNQNLLPFPSKSLHSQSACPRSREKPDIAPYIPISPRQASARKLKLAKQAIIRRLTVEKNKEKMLQALAEERLALEQVLMNKLSKSTKKDNKSKFFQTQERRIQEILHKKYRDLQEREEKALENSENQESKKDVRGSSFFYSQRRSLAVREEEDVQQKLFKIQSKLINSAERAKKNLAKKNVPINSNSTIFEKVQQHKEELQIKQQEDQVRKIQKIQQDLAESCKRREDMFNSLQEKRARSTKAIEYRHVEEQLKIQQDVYEKEKSFEKKQERIEKSRMNRKERIEKSSQAISNKNFLRKKEQEKNLQKVNRSYVEFRNSLIQKFKENDVKVKNFIDYSKLRMAVEKEMKRKEMEINDC